MWSKTEAGARVAYRVETYGKAQGLLISACTLAIMSGHRPTDVRDMLDEISWKGKAVTMAVLVAAKIKDAAPFGELSIAKAEDVVFDHVEARKAEAGSYNALYYRLKGERTPDEKAALQAYHATRAVLEAECKRLGALVEAGADGFAKAKAEADKALKDGALNVDGLGLHERANLAAIKAAQAIIDAGLSVAKGAVEAAKADAKAAADKAEAKAAAKAEAETEARVSAEAAALTAIGHMTDVEALRRVIEAAAARIAAIEAAAASEAEAAAEAGRKAEAAAAKDAAEAAFEAAAA